MRRPKRRTGALGPWERFGNPKGRHVTVACHASCGHGQETPSWHLAERQGPKVHLTPPKLESDRYSLQVQLGPIFVLRVCIDRVLPTPEWNTSGVVIPLGLNRTATAKKAIDGRNATSVAPGLQLQYPILKVFTWMVNFFFF